MRQTGYPSIDKPWEKYYSIEAITSPLPEKTIYNYIRELNADNMNHVAFNYYGKNYSYGNFFSLVDEVASSLHELGVKSGDAVTVIMINSPETISLMFAINKIGAVANMVYGSGSIPEIEKAIKDVDSRIVFTLDIFQDKIVEISAHLPVQKVIVSRITDSMSAKMKIGAFFSRGSKLHLPSDSLFINWNTFLKLSTHSSPTAINHQAPAMITYTGGTTGGSKGVILSNYAIIAVAQQFIDIGIDLRRESSWVQVLPLFIAYGVTCSLMVPMMVGMKTIIRLPMAESLTAICKKFHPNHIMYGPAYWERMADENAKIDLSYLIEPISGGDTLKPSVEEKINNYLKRCGSRYPLMNGYGMTEVGAGVAVNNLTAHKLGTVGIPWPKSTISAFDIDSGIELPYGQLGEICIHTPSTMMGYVNNKEETDNIIRIHEDSLRWVHSGDYGYIDEDGYVYILGRLKRYMLCISNGVQKKVFSLDIEKVLLKHPVIENCAVVPMPDKQINQVPVAYIITKKGVQYDDKLLTDIQQYCIKNLEMVYRPVKYVFIEKFPLTKVGKVDYQELERRVSV